MMPIPKRRGSGVCKTDEYCGISLASVAYKAMSAIIHGRLTPVVGEENLVAEKQGGFRKGRADQISLHRSFRNS